MGQQMIVCEELIEVVADLIGQRHHKHAIKRRLEAELETTIAIKTFEIIMSRARQKLRDHLEKSSDVAKCEAVEFYESVIRNEKSSWKSKIRAQKQLDLIYGVRGGESAEEKVRKAQALLQEAVGTVPDTDDDE